MNLPRNNDFEEKLKRQAEIYSGQFFSNETKFKEGLNSDGLQDNESNYSHLSISKQSDQFDEECQYPEKQLLEFQRKLLEKEFKNKFDELNIEKDLKSELDGAILEESSEGSNEYTPFFISSEDDTLKNKNDLIQKLESILQMQLEEEEVYDLKLLKEIKDYFEIMNLFQFTSDSIKNQDYHRIIVGYSEKYKGLFGLYLYTIST